MKKLSAIIIALILLTACASAALEPTAETTSGVQELGVLHVDPPEGLDTAETVEFVENYVSIVIPLPDGWEYKVNEHEGEPAGGQGITIFKGGDESRTAHIQFTENFAVCGTGLSTAEADFPSGEKATIGYYDGGKDWSFITFNDTAGEYVVTNTNFTGEDALEALEIIGQANVGGDWLTESQAKAIALDGQPEYDYDYVRTHFDTESGVWTVSMRNNPAEEAEAVVKIDVDGNIL